MTDRNLTFGKRSKVTKPKFKRDDKVAISTNGMRGVYQTIVSSIPKERVGRNISINNSADVVIERVVMNTQNIFKGNVVLEDQTYIALSIEALREDSSLFSFIYSLDWKNYVLDGQKTSFLKELGSRVSDILGVKVDLVNHYTETAKDVMEVINELKESQSPFNINFFTFINLMSKGLFSIEETDTTWINGQSVLVSPYSGRAESFSALARRAAHRQRIRVSGVCRATRAGADRLRRRPGVGHRFRVELKDDHVRQRDQERVHELDERAVQELTSHDESVQLPDVKLLSTSFIRSVLHR